MINKRGLTPSEFDELPEELFDYLLVFDSLIEPSGIEIDMTYHTTSLYTQTVLSSNLSKESRRSVKPEDYDFLQVLGDNRGLTYGEKTDKFKEEQNNKQANNISAFGAMIMAEAMKAQEKNNE